MEHSSAKTSSSITEIVSKFAKIFRFIPIGIFPFENRILRLHNHSLNESDKTLGEDSSVTSEARKFDLEKFCSHPEEVQIPTKTACDDFDIVKLLDMVSALKSAYIKLQEAHLPYDTEKIVAADECVVAHLQALCKLKRAYKEKQSAKVKSYVSELSSICAKVEASGKLLGKLKADVKAKESQILHLQERLRGLNSANAELAEKMDKQSLGSLKARVLDIFFFQEIFMTASKSIHDFAKPLISLMKAAGWDLNLAAYSIEGPVVYSKSSHKKYAFEAYIARRMFHGISLQSYCIDDIMHFDDPIDAVIAHPESGFAQFCREKYLIVVHPKLEASFFGNLDQRAFVTRGKHPRTPFYHAFVKMAKWIWIIQGIVATIDSKAKIFSVKKGCLYSDTYMESVEEVSPDASRTNKEAMFKVEFMVMPGFRIGKTVVRSRVYLSRTLP